MNEVVADMVVVGAGLTEGQVVACITPAGLETGWYHNSCLPEQQEPIQDSVLHGSVSYGFVIENSSDQVVLDLPVTYRFLDAAGEVIVEAPTAFSGSDNTSDSERIPILGPRERVGIGGMKYPGRPGAAEMQIEIGDPSGWISEAAYNATTSHGGRGELTITELAVQPGDQNQPITTFTVESSYEEALESPATYVVFYDTDGQIIGGADGYAFDPHEHIPAGGTMSGEVVLDDPIEVPGIDPSQTEIYFPGIRVAQR